MQYKINVIYYNVLKSPGDSLMSINKMKQNKTKHGN